MDEEFLLNFSKKEVPFDLEDYEVTLKLLKSRYDSQTDYIQKSILKCVEEMKEKKMKSDC